MRSDFERSLQHTHTHVYIAFYIDGHYYRYDPALSNRPPLWWGGGGDVDCKTVSLI